MTLETFAPLRERLMLRAGSAPSREKRTARSTPLWPVPALLVTAVLALGASRPGFTQGDDALLYTDRDVAGTSRLFTSAPDGSDRRRLFEGEGPMEMDGRWSPDGRRVVFSSLLGEDDMAIVIYEPEGGAPIALNAGFVDLDPTWSPDGAWIAYVRQITFDGALQASLLSMTRSGGGEQRELTLLESDARAMRNPVWSPDGRQLVFELRQAAGGSDLYRAEIDGGAIHRILGHPGWDDIEPAFSPDGRYLAFASGVYETTTERSRHGIWLLDLESGVYGELAADPGLDLRRPAWSPDGTRLAFDAGDGSTAPRMLHVIDATGGPVESIGAPIITGFEASWRPPVSTAPSPTPEPVTPTATLEPTPGNTGTAISEPTLPPLPTLVPFPTFPPPEPTVPPPAPSFPPPTATATPSATLTPVASATPEPRPIYLPLTLNKGTIRETSTPTPETTPDENGPTPTTGTVTSSPSPTSTPIRTNPPITPSMTPNATSGLPSATPTATP